MSNTNRWGIAAAGFLMQMALGAVYAWSVFRIPLAKQFHWSISQVTLTFTICVFVLGISAFFGGLWLNKKGPRVVALTAGFLYGLGVFLASYSADKLWWLYLSYGLIGGIGLGFGYIVPIAVLVKWFPDRRGLITGIAVAGFGGGALVTAPAATYLIQSVGVLKTFAYLGIAYLVVTMSTGFFMRNPPDGWRPEGWIPSATQTKQRAAKDYTLGGALSTWQWWAMWLLLFLNTSAGISPDIAGIADVSGDCKSQRDRRRGHGGNRQHRQRGWPHFLGLDLRRSHPPMDFRDHVSGAGWAVLGASKSCVRFSPDRSVIHHSDVLRRGIRNHAGICSRLLRIEKRGSDLRTDDHRMGHLRAHLGRC